MFIQTIGTGKTYLGLRIIQALLVNAKQSPIVIACYTNHALDQFLEGISKFCATGELVRIGKTKSEALAECLLSKIKIENRAKRSKGERIRMNQNRNKISNQMESIRQTLSSLEAEVNCINSTILGKEITEIICDLNPNHRNQLQVPEDSDLATNVLNWLGYRLQENDESISDDSESESDGSSNFDEENLRTFRDRFHLTDDATNQPADVAVHHKMFSGPIDLNNVVPISHVDNDNG